MTKEELQKSFSERLTGAMGGGKYALSEQSISDYVDAVLPTITETNPANDAFFDFHTKVLKTLDGNLRHDNSISIKSAEETWKKKFEEEWKKTHPDNKIDGKDGEGQNKQGEDDELIGKLKKLLGLETTNQQKQVPNANEPSEETKKIAALEEKINQLLNARAAEQSLLNETTMRTNAKTAIDALIGSEATSTHKFLAQHAVDGVKIEKDMTYDAFLTAVKAKYEADLKSCLGDGAMPYAGNGGGSSNDNDIVKRHLEKLKQSAEEAEKLERVRKSYK